jgi:uncharacterized protein
MKLSTIAFAAGVVFPAMAVAQTSSPAPTQLPAQAGDPAYTKSVLDWRAKVDKSLRNDNNWLTLAGRFVLKPGENLFGTGKTNDIVFPPGVGYPGMGSVFVEPEGKIRVKLVEGVKMKNSEGIEFTERVLVSEKELQEWHSIGRASFQFIQRGNLTILRLADKESEVRKKFGGRVWYPVDDRYRVPAKFIPYNPPKKIPIVNILDQVSDEPAPGYIEFELNGRTYTLDVVGEDEGLFVIFRDETASDTTYGAGRYLYVEERPQPGVPFKFDLNRAYNPPCAFTEFATCPLPPKQNILKIKVEAGEKYPPLKKEL